MPSLAVGRCLEAPAAVAAGALLGLGLLLAPAVSAADLSPQEERGKQIYVAGTSPREEPIAALVGHDSTRLPGFAATCASCHGPDGRGRPEAGVIPADVTWDYLFKPYGHSHPMGRSHPAFTVESLRDSIRHGRDPAGNELDSSMPRYELSDADLDDLIAYMRRLAADLDPGLSGTAVRIGTMLPAGGPSSPSRVAPIGQGIREVIAAYFDEINSRGGIYGRRLELIELPDDNRRQSPLVAATRLLEEGDVFAVLSPMVAGADDAIGELVEDRKVPVIGPVTLFSPDPYVLNDYTFYVFSGLREQVRALVDFAAGELGLERPRWTVVAPENDRYRDIREAIAEQSRTHGWAPEAAVALSVGEREAAGAAARLAANGTEVLFWLGPGGLEALLAAGEEIGWRPWVLLPGAMISPRIFDLPQGFQNRVYSSYPTAPSDQTAAGIAEIRTLLDSHGFSMGHRTSQVAAFVSTKILVEGLKSAGSDLSRDKLLRALEKMYEIRTGLTPPITFGANRRIGALGAYVVTVDLKNRDFVPVGGWITPR